MKEIYYLHSIGIRKNRKQNGIVFLISQNQCRMRCCVSVPLFLLYTYSSFLTVALPVLPELLLSTCVHIFHIRLFDTQCSNTVHICPA